MLQWSAGCFCLQHTDETRFCLAGLEVGITPRALPSGWTVCIWRQHMHPFNGVDALVITALSQGWWNKIVLFSPDSGLRGRVLFIDLDTVITASLAPVLSYTVRVCTRAVVNDRPYRRTMMWWLPGTKGWTLGWCMPPKT